jgi:exodeoxyribonuclease VII small subunit
MTSKGDYRTLQRELDEVLDKLQSEDVAIDEATELYERGMELTKELEKLLKQAENTITKLKARFQ